MKFLCVEGNMNNKRNILCFSNTQRQFCRRLWLDLLFIATETGINILEHDIHTAANVLFVRFGF